MLQRRTVICMHMGKSIRIGIVVAWLLTLGLYVRFEAYPVWFTRTISGYRGMIPDALLTRETWARILIEDQPTGYVHTTLTMNDDEPIPVFEIATRIHLRARILNQPQRILLSFDSTLNQDYDPIAFRAVAAAGDFTVQIQAEHQGDRQFVVHVQTGDTTTTRTITLPPNAVFFTPLQELTLQQLRPGSSLVLRTLDPLTLQTMPVVITAQPRETIQIGTNTVSALPVEAVWQGIRFQSWLDQETGAVLRQETPFGWVFEACSSEEALAAVADEQDTAPPQLLRGIGSVSLLQILLRANQEETP